MTHVIECPACGEISLKQFRIKHSVEEWECVCGHFEVWTPAQQSTKRLLAENKRLVAGIRSAIEVLTNDLYVSRAVNAKILLQAVLDETEDNGVD